VAAARAHRQVSPAPERVIEPADPRARELLGQYIAGFENADTTALEKALRADASIEMVGTRLWFSGRETCLRYLAHVIGSPGDWRMHPTLANGQPAATGHYRGAAFGLGVLTVTRTGISRITVFDGGPGLTARFRDAGPDYTPISR
jgi:RNA polymerase sigma-70 factor (ECF subfamily)